MTHEQRFWSHVDKTDGCWLWRLAPNGPDGYGRFSHDNQRTMAHRYAYELMVGPIPAGLTLDHLCRNTRCVRPDHLEPVTLRENVLRSDAPPVVNRRKTHCKRGHEFTEANTYRRPDGFRECIACRDMHMAAFRQRNPRGRLRELAGSTWLGA